MNHENGEKKNHKNKWFAVILITLKLKIFIYSNAAANMSINMNSAYDVISFKL